MGGQDKREGYIRTFAAGGGWGEKNEKERAGGDLAADVVLTGRGRI